MNSYKLIQSITLIFFLLFAAMNSALATGELDDFEKAKIEGEQKAQKVIDACWQLSEKDRDSGITANMRGGAANSIGCMERVLLKLVSGYLFKKQPEKVKEFEGYLDSLRVGYHGITWDLYNSHDECPCGSMYHLFHLSDHARVIEGILRTAFEQIYEYGLEDKNLEPRFLIDADPARAKTRE